MMNSFVAFVIFFVSASQSPRQEPTIPVRAVCGTVVYSHELPKKKPSDEAHYKRSPMRNFPVLLYPREEGVSCCQNRSPIASVETGRTGNFKFTGISPGKFWVVVHRNGHDAMTPIRYEPLKDAPAGCSDYTFVLNDAGELSWSVTVTVD